MENTHWLIEQLKTIHNLAEISQILISLEREDLLYTVLEFIFSESQDMNDSYCVVREE